ncbi:MAG: YceD family protein [Hyphomicrobium sp.]
MSSPPSLPAANSATIQADWVDETRDLGERERKVSRTANAGQRARLADDLGLLACERLQFEYAVQPRGEGRYRVRGRLDADVTQACIVTLEPVPATLSEEVDVSFWPAHLVGLSPGGGEQSILAGDDPEPIGPMGRLETGRIAFEVVSAALDPYPRKQGAEFSGDGASDGEDDPSADHPFAALARLKGEPPRD